MELTFARQGIFIFLLLISRLSSIAQVDDIGSGHALRFDGVDDYVEMQSDYSTFNLPFTISAWIKVDPANNDSALIVFSSNDNNPLYHGFYLAVGHGAIWCEYGDNTGDADIHFRQGKKANVPEFYGKWTHVAAVMKSKTEFELYINGINVGGSFSGQSTSDMHSPYPGDKAKAGYLLSDGVTYRFQGDMDELRLWSRALTEDELRESMCHKLTGNETGLTSYWTFNETSGSTTYDKAKKSFNGILIGNPTQVYSGAPIGDVSFGAYQVAATTFETWVFDDNDVHATDNFFLKGMGPHIIGHHTYRVDSSPSQVGNLPPLPHPPTHYYGVFLISDSPQNPPLATVQTVEVSPGFFCAFKRTDNSVPTWETPTSLTGTIDSQQAEFIRAYLSTSDLKVDLGPDRTICYGDQLSVGPFPVIMNNLSARWSTSEFNAIIDVNQGSSLDVNKSGTYWVEVQSGCFFASDTVDLDVVPQVLVSLGPDLVVCEGAVVHLEARVSITENYTYKWNTGESAKEINVARPGTYSVTVTGGCSPASDEIKIDMLKAPPKFSLGNDGVFCVLPPIHLNPVLDASSGAFEWQDKSNNPSFDVKDFGSYWLTFKNSCGESSDTVTYTKSGNVDLPQIPNVITPNGDDHNDFFVIPGGEAIDIDLLVLNRWGERVFTAPGYQNDWDGKGLAPGIYFYVVEGQCVNPMKGSLTIIR